MIQEMWFGKMMVCSTLSRCAGCNAGARASDYEFADSPAHFIDNQTVTHTIEQLFFMENHPWRHPPLLFLKWVRSTLEHRCGLGIGF